MTTTDKMSAPDTTTTDEVVSLEARIEARNRAEFLAVAGYGLEHVPAEHRGTALSLHVRRDIHKDDPVVVRWITRAGEEVTRDEATWGELVDTIVADAKTTPGLWEDVADLLRVADGEAVKMGMGDCIVQPAGHIFSARLPAGQDAVEEHKALLAALKAAGIQGKRAQRVEDLFVATAFRAVHHPATWGSVAFTVVTRAHDTKRLRVRALPQGVAAWLMPHGQWFIGPRGGVRTWTAEGKIAQGSDAMIDGWRQ